MAARDEDEDFFNKKALDSDSDSDAERERFFDANDDFLDKPMSNKTTSNDKYVPLHERMNKNLNLNKQEEEEEEDKDDLESDPLYINEKKLKLDEENLTAEQLEERYKNALEKKDIGNKNFKELNFTQAIELYTQALQICPLNKLKDRSILYSNRSASLLKITEMEKCIRDCTKSIELDATYTKPLLRRAECYEKTEKLDEALVDYKKLLELEPHVYAYRSKSIILEQKVNERNEKLKTEMMSKLKDLGNLVLKPFGLSTNNFNLVKDENTGSYSVNFNNK